jgi:ribonuclease Z
MAQDYMVWNVTKDEIRTRMTFLDHESWNPPVAYAAEPIDPDDMVGYSPLIEAG